MYRSRRKIFATMAGAGVVLLALTGCTAEEPAGDSAGDAQSSETADGAGTDSGANEELEVDQDELLIEIDQYRGEGAKTDCEVFEQIAELNALTAHLDPEIVGDTLGDRLEQTTQLFDQLESLSENEAEGASWERISAAAGETREQLDQYGGEIMNNDVLTALADLAVAYSEADEQHGEAVSQRCGIDSDTLFAVGDVG